MKDPIVKWLKEPESTKASCLICKNSHNNKIILEALHWNKNYGFLKVASCSECKSAWFIDAEKEISLIQVLKTHLKMIISYILFITT